MRWIGVIIYTCPLLSIIRQCTYRLYMPHLFDLYQDSLLAPKFSVAYICLISCLSLRIQYPIIYQKCHISVDRLDTVFKFSLIFSSSQCHSASTTKNCCDSVLQLAGGYQKDKVSPSQIKCISKFNRFRTNQNSGTSLSLSRGTHGSPIGTFEVGQV